MLQPGDRIDDRFEVEALLGEGGLAQVFRVRHRTLGTVHAVKLLTMAHPNLADRLIQEGRIQAQLRHPNIVAVTDVLVHQGRPGLLMEFLDGETLEALLARGALPVEEALSLFAAVLAAVATAHAAGVLHRDLKPANVILARTTTGVVPKVMDFGIAKIAQSEGGQTLTRAGVAMGTPGYMAPEQIEDAAHVDRRADIFSLGSILYEMLTGARAFPAQSFRDSFNAASEGRFEAPEALRPECPPEASAAIRRALAGQPEDRFPDCESFAEALFVDRPALYAQVVGGRASAPTLAPVRTGEGEALKKSGAGRGSDSATWAAPPEAAPSSRETLAPAPSARKRAAAKRAARNDGWSVKRAILLGGVLGLLFGLGALRLGIGVFRRVAERRAAEAAVREAAQAPPPAPPPAAPPTEADAPPAPPPEATSAAPPAAEAPPTSSAAASSARTGASASAARSGATGATSASAPEAEVTPTVASSEDDNPWGGASSSSSASSTPNLVGVWSTDSWSVRILNQTGARVDGYAYRSVGRRVPVSGSYDSGTRRLTLNDSEGDRMVFTGKVDRDAIKGTLTVGRGEAQPWDAKRSN